MPLSCIFNATNAFDRQQRSHSACKDKRSELAFCHGARQRTYEGVLSDLQSSERPCYKKICAFIWSRYMPFVPNEVLRKSGPWRSGPGEVKK